MTQFTVFTPTYNRPELTGRVYQSLLAQTYTDFEWLIVEDGSTDDCSAQVREWQRSAPFPIRYEVQRHQGKHHAHNKAIALACGELFAVLDSDDAIVPYALERLLFHWRSIPQECRPNYSGVSCLCMNESSAIVGRPFPRDVLDCRHYEAETRFGATGERWGFHRTEVLRQFPFPTIAGEQYCPEGLVWNRIATRYLIRHVNEPLRTFYSSSGDITPRVRTVLMRNPLSAGMFYRECLGLEAPLSWRCKRAVNYVRYSLHGRAPVSGIITGSGHPLITAAAAIPAFALYTTDQLRSCRQ